MGVFKKKKKPEPKEEKPIMTMWCATHQCTKAACGCPSEK